MSDSDEKRYECTYDDCDKSYGMKGNLKIHIDTFHLGIKYDCTYDDCDKSYGRKGDLKRHIETFHLGIKNFECEYDGCKKSFGDKSELNRHIDNVHKNIRNFECEYDGCKRKFGEKHHLDRHINNVHKNIRNFECDDCKRTFGQKTDLDKHIKRVHLKIKDNECPNCSYKSSEKCHLDRHLKRCTGTRNISGGEYQVLKALQDLNFIEDEDFIYNQTFEGLTSHCGKHLRFDFRFLEHDIAIEYDGRQHFEPVTFGGISKERAEENLKILQENDKIKNAFCTENGFRLIRISYKDFANILSILSEKLEDIVDWIG